MKTTCIGKRQKSPTKWVGSFGKVRTLESLALQRSSVRLTCEWGRWERNLSIHFAKKKRISRCCGPVDKWSGSINHPQGTSAFTTGDADLHFDSTFNVMRVASNVTLLPGRYSGTFSLTRST